MPKWLRPLAVFAVVSMVAFALSEAHVLKPGAPKAAAGSTVELGDAYRGETVFQQKCASCHGVAGKNGTVGPTLAGASLTVGQVKAQIDAGGGAMPAGLVSGGEEQDVLAYVASIVAQ